MGAYLTLNSVSTGHPLAESELAELLLTEKRYKKVRMMNPKDFAAIWRHNLDGENNEWKTFDELVDQWG